MGADDLERRPAGARVGTVDKFQGQEAAVVLVSMTTSTAEDVSRGLEFLYSRNRLNVGDIAGASFGDGGGESGAVGGALQYYRSDEVGEYVVLCEGVCGGRCRSPE